MNRNHEREDEHPWRKFWEEQPGNGWSVCGMPSNARARQRRCPACGKLLDEKEQSCPACGSPIHAGSQE